MSCFWSDVTFVRIAGEIGQEGDCRRVFVDDAVSVFAFGFDDVVKEYASGLFVVSPADTSLGLDCFEDKVRRVNLAMRMRIGNTDDVPFVLENQHMIHLGV